jgi:phage-related holin
MTPEQNNLTYLAKLFGSVCKDVALKCTATGVLVISEFLIDNALAKAMLALFILVIFDWVTGVMAAKKTGEHIKSSKIVRTPVKLVVYFMLITGARIAEYSMPDLVHFIDEAVIAFLTTTELISLIENTGRIGYAIPRKLLNKLKSIRDDESITT